MTGWCKIALIATAGLLAGCSPKQYSPASAESAAEPGSGDVVTPVSATDLPPEVASVVAAAAPDMRVTEAERKEREGRVYYDVEGVRADGTEIELDLLGENGVFKVVEIQRDIAWAEAPESARTAAAASPKAFEPVRVIESTQTDGTVIYELFAEGAPAKPSLEVKLQDGKAEVLDEVWPH